MMGFLFGLTVVVFVFVCIFLVFLVLIQSDKGGGISGAIGGGLSGANTLLGTRDAANILTRGTTVFAISYMVLCILLSLFLSRFATGEGKSVLKERAKQQESYSPSSVLEEGALPLLTDEDEEASSETSNQPLQLEGESGGEGIPELEFESNAPAESGDEVKLDESVSGDEE